MYPDKPGGPRADERPIPDDIDGYDNLILLCKTDHKRVDDQPRYFSIKRLQALKEAHETWVDTTLERDLKAIWLLRLLRSLWPFKPDGERYALESVGTFQTQLGARHRYLREASLQLDPRRMADFYGFTDVSELERYEAGHAEFPAKCLSRLRETFFVRDQFLRGTSPFVFSTLQYESQVNEINRLLDLGFQLCFLASPKDRADLLVYPYLFKLENGFPRGVIAHRLSSFSRAAGGGAANIYQIIDLMISRRMEPTTVRFPRVREHEWGWLESGRYYMGEAGPTAYPVDFECQGRFIEMFSEYKA